MPLHMAAALVAAVLTAILVAGAPALAQVQALIEHRGERLGTAEILVQNFRLMAFDGGGGSLRRWNQPVRAILIGEAADTYRNEVRALFAAFSELTGVSFALTADESQANMRIFFSAREFYRTAVAEAFAQPANILCFTQTRSAGTGAIAAVTTVIPEDLNPRAARSCLAHELMHAIGFQGHPQRTFDSALLNGAVAADRLTMNDRILIRALYDPRLRPNLSAQASMAIATGVIDALLAEVLEAEAPM